MNDWRRFTRLPESSEYWRGLGQRVTEAARPELVRRGRRDRWLDATLAAAATAAAAAIVLLLLRPAASTTDASLQAGLAPKDPIALELLSIGEAPHVSGLLPAYAPGTVR